MLPEKQNNCAALAQWGNDGSLSWSTRLMLLKDVAEGMSYCKWLPFVIGSRCSPKQKTNRLLLTIGYLTHTHAVVCEHSARNTPLDSSRFEEPKHFAGQSAKQQPSVRRQSRRCGALATTKLSNHSLRRFSFCAFPPNTLCMLL